MENNNNENDKKKNSDWSEREVGALWRVDGSNQSFYSGSIKVNGKSFKIVCFKNKFKEANTNQPDLRIYEQKDDERPRN
jgi:hypothetical protein